MSVLELTALTVRRGECPVVDHVSLTVQPGEFVGLIGPNGAGKTTLMRAALGLLPHEGQSSLASMAPRARARAAAWMPQTREIAWGVSVETLVGLGRGPHLGPGGRMTLADRMAIDDALWRMELCDFRDRIATRLSGGEQARALIARTLAQEAPLLMADEPTAGLDPAHQIHSMQVFADLVDEGQAVIASIHELGLAARYCTRLVLMGQGRLVADGAPADVLTPDNLAQVFGLRAFYADTEDGVIFQPLQVVGRDKPMGGP